MFNFLQCSCSNRIPHPSVGLSTAPSTKSQQTIKANASDGNTSTTSKIIRLQINDYDAECAGDPCHVSDYAADIFNYFKEREKHFQVTNYMPDQPYIDARMRAGLIDWMALAQESFGLNMETLYLAVKLVDLVLNTMTIQKENLQLLGAGAIFLAAKFEVRSNT